MSVPDRAETDTPQQRIAVRCMPTGEQAAWHGSWSRLQKLQRDACLPQAHTGVQLEDELEDNVALRLVQVASVAAR